MATKLKHHPADRAHCSYCGIAEDIHLLDGVLKDERDTGKLGCIKCYPDEGWCPTGVEHIALSIAPSLKPLYFNWLKREEARAKSSGDRLHEIYDGNGRRRDRGGFCS